MLDRRSFLKGAAACLPALSAAEPETSRREVLSFNRNWLYGGKTVPGAAAPDFDDRRFARVTLPHTNRMLPWHSFDDRSFQFVSVYRRRFRVPERFQGRRVFVDFAGVMTAATVTLNGSRLGEYKGGYTPFSFELTPHLNWSGENVLAVEVDSTERADIPPFGGNIDYLTFGGIYREVTLRAVPQSFIENVYAKPVDVLGENRRMDVRCYLQNAAGPFTLSVELRDGGRVLKAASREFTPSGAEHYDVPLTAIGPVELWDLDRPKLYRLAVRLSANGRVLDEYSLQTGFREARFTPKGFYLNGRHLKLRGLNRHQTYPYAGGAMPARVQRRDALILKKELKCNIVRTSHYPQSTHFLDCCDEIGLLVFEEIPGWQHIGDKAWRELALRNAGEMIRRDWNHPAIILWGVRINESDDNHELYTRTNQLAHSLDDTRQTGGVRYKRDSERLEDVFTMNDFGFPLQPPNHPLYLNTEFNGHMFSTKRIDNVERVAEHVLRHARVHNQLASDDRYAGGIGWCAFDYNTHANFGSGDRICYHGVSDIFRVPKPAAGFYKSQCDPKEEIVLEPGFFWSGGDRATAGGPGLAPICSNCDHLKIYIDGKLKTEVNPDRERYGHLAHPPFIADLRDLPLSPWGDLRIDGYIGGKLAVSKTLSGSGVDAQLALEPDDKELDGDGIDATRVVFRVTDEYGNTRQFATGVVALAIEGPGEIVGENPFAVAGGVGAVWVKAKESSGLIRLRATHPLLGARSAEIRVRPAPGEAV